MNASVVAFFGRNLPSQESRN